MKRLHLEIGLLIVSQLLSNLTCLIKFHLATEGKRLTIAGNGWICGYKGNDTTIKEACFEISFHE